MAKVCAACGKKIGAFSEWQSTKNGCLCQKCYDRIIPFRNDVMTMTDAEASSALRVIELNDAAIASFKETGHIGQKLEYVAFFDDDSRAVMLPQRVCAAIEDQNFWVFSYDDIIGAELLQNEKRVSTSGLARAVVGGVLLGVAGAVAGAASAQDARANSGSDVIDVRVEVRNYTKDTFTVNVSRGGLADNDPKNGILLSYAAELVDKLNEIAGAEDEPAIEYEPEPARDIIDNTDPVELIRKYKGLLDDGIITEEEFQTKKAQLLDL